jgi:hypothetical protein
MNTLAVGCQARSALQPQYRISSSVNATLQEIFEGIIYALAQSGSERRIFAAPTKVTKMPTISVDKAALFEALGQKYVSFEDVVELNHN